MRNYKREDVKIAANEYFKGDGLSSDVWINKYALKDSDDNIYEMTPIDMHNRIASELSRIEHKYPNPLSQDLIFDLTVRCSVCSQRISSKNRVLFF